jgi:hypothetical protein
VCFTAFRGFGVEVVADAGLDDVLVVGLAASVVDVLAVVPPQPETSRLMATNNPERHM